MLPDLGVHDEVPDVFGIAMGLDAAGGDAGLKAILDVPLEAHHGNITYLLL